jgi:hypothetical protein
VCGALLKLLRKLLGKLTLAITREPLFCVAKQRSGLETACGRHRVQVGLAPFDLPQQVLGCRHGLRVLRSYSDQRADRPAGVSPRETASLAGRRELRLVLARPAHDVAGPRDDLAAVEDEDRDRSLTADPLELGAIASAVRQRPEFSVPPLTCFIS